MQPAHYVWLVLTRAIPPEPPPPPFSPATFLGLGYLLPRRFINEIVRLADGNTLRIRTYTLTGLRTFEVWGGRGGARGLTATVDSAPYQTT